MYQHIQMLGSVLYFVTLAKPNTDGLWFYYNHDFDVQFPIWIGPS